MQGSQVTCQGQSAGEGLSQDSVPGSLAPEPRTRLGVSDGVDDLEEELLLCPGGAGLRRV